MVPEEPVVLVERQGAVALLRLNRPEQRNTVTYEVLDALIAAADAIERDDDVRAVVLTGTGRFFSAGTDLSARDGFRADGSDFRPLRGGSRDVGGELSLRIFESSRPWITAYNGTAVGIGVTMALPTDIRIAADDARFGLPFTRRGIVPESCGSWFLPRLVGIGKAVEWTMTGRIFAADEALRAGLVHELVPADQVLDRALAVAGDIAEGSSPVAVTLARQMLWRGLSEAHPVSANRLESQAMLALTTGPDVKEGVSAFREKRPPRFASRRSADLPDFYPWWTTPPWAG
jgi:enoyl-CoA hydratase/carnithine racemase